jgi:hypothetical protein
MRPILTVICLLLLILKFKGLILMIIFFQITLSPSSSFIGMTFKKINLIIIYAQWCLYEKIFCFPAICTLLWKGDLLGRPLWRIHFSYAAQGTKVALWVQWEPLGQSITLRVTWTTTEFDSLLERFTRIFPRQLGQQFLYVAGNHDLGWKIDYSNNVGEKIVDTYVT